MERRKFLIASLGFLRYGLVSFLRTAKAKAMARIRKTGKRIVVTVIASRAIFETRTTTGSRNITADPGIS
jgi:hypothetical protein